MRDIKLGSLFDGAGTAPLAATMCGIRPAWASEIEPYPIKVTTARFPEMKHLGDITKIDGAAIEPVDIICGGSPCQDLSVAGKQKGLIDGERSHLFFEMTRIIKQMREATNGKYPRYIVWENVPGAFSSNKGHDFLAVLQAFAEIGDPLVHVPGPACKRNTDRLDWKRAGTVMGDGFSIAWRTVDAQYWGVPQRRRRIYLVADLGGHRAAEILFERESVRGNHPKIGEERQGTAAAVEKSARASNLPRVKCLNPWDVQSHRLFDVDGSFHTLYASERAGGQTDGVVFESKSMLEENWKQSNTKNALRAGASKSSHAVVCFDRQRTDTYGESDIASSLCTRDYKGATDLVCAIDCRNGNESPDVNGTLQAKSNGGFSLNCNQVVRIGYAVRRLTPLECCRLQGFPDWWTEGCDEEHPVTAEYVDTDALDFINPNGKIEGSDSAKYKMWGNGMALPNMLHVMKGIAGIER